MMKHCKLALAAGLSLATLAQPVLAAPICANQIDMAAFRTAAVAQQLMVAALTCHDIEAYNLFVRAYQPELQKSDNDLKAYFIRRSKEADYDTYKTKLANLSSLSDIADGPAYCATSAAAFDVALRGHQPLGVFVDSQPLLIALPAVTVCAAPGGSIRAAVSPSTIAGVPSHDMPASPFGGNTPVTAMAASSDDAAPPRPARTPQATQREDYYRSVYAPQDGR